MTAADGGWTVERLGPAQDLGGVLAVAVASFRNGWTPAMFARELERGDVAHLFVARGPEGAVAGYCSAWLVRGELHINGLAVDPARRRRGAARAARATLAPPLLRHALDEGRRLGAAEALLEVRRANRAARRLYEAAGFAVRTVRPRYYLQPVDDALIMQLRLAGGAPEDGRPARLETGHPL